VFVDGQHVTTLRGTYDELAKAFQALVDEYVEKTYPAGVGVKTPGIRVRHGYPVSSV
jgi:hypothetical protein